MLPLLLLAAAVSDQSAAAAMIPENIRAMLDAALASGNEGDVATVVKYARVVDPLSGDAVLALADKWRADRAAAREQVIRQASFLTLWAGRAELGGFITTGNSRVTGLSAIVDATREGLRWRHKFRAQGDYQESNGVASRERLLVSYEPNYKIDPRAYLYGAAQFESDRFLGYDGRVSVSTGAGYSVLKRRGLQLDVELGPGYRYTEATDGTTQSSVAGRGSFDLRVRILPGLGVSQTASAYIQRYNSTVSTKSALEAKLLGPLAAQLSYSVQYESMPPEDRRTTDTISRAALVYSF